MDVVGEDNMKWEEASGEKGLPLLSLRFSRGSDSSRGARRHSSHNQLNSHSAESGAQAACHIECSEGIWDEAHTCNSGLAFHTYIL